MFDDNDIEQMIEDQKYAAEMGLNYAAYKREKELSKYPLDCTSPIDEYLDKHPLSEFKEGE